MNLPIIVLIGPSAVGKSSFLDRALKDNLGLCDIVTYTSRSMRPGEKNGVHYHFVNQKEFEDLKAKDFFVEWALVHGNYYGTPKDQIQEAWLKGQTVIMDIDVQGAQSIKRLYPQAVSIFLMPPSVDELRQRLKKRGSADDLDLRLANAQREMALADQFDHVIINDDFESAYKEFRKIVEKASQNQ
ncbi:guanylate kinase [bacterium]|nr:guanylate kinase [bacterium]